MLTQFSRKHVGTIFEALCWYKSRDKCCIFNIVINFYKLLFSSELTNLIESILDWFSL